MRSCSCDRLSIHRAQAGPFGGSGICCPTCSCFIWSWSSAIDLSPGDRFLCTPTGPAHEDVIDAATQKTVRTARTVIFIGASVSTAQFDGAATLPISAQMRGPPILTCAGTEE